MEKPKRIEFIVYPDQVALNVDHCCEDYKIENKQAAALNAIAAILGAVK